MSAHTPWVVKHLRDMISGPGVAAGLPDGRWVRSVPEPYEAETIRERLIAVWWVWTGRAHAVVWPKAGELERAIGSLPQAEEDGRVHVAVSGLTGTGKSAIAGEIEIALRAIGVPVEWVDSRSEKYMTGSDWQAAIDAYRPRVVIRERNIPRALSSARDQARKERG